MNLTAENTVAWKSPSNIALVKYWGKHGNQLPINPSLSITLNKSTTTTGITYRLEPDAKGLHLNFSFEGQPAPAFGERITKFLRAQSHDYPQLQSLSLDISSSNTFPHSSGIASSASAFSALALGMLTILRKLTEGGEHTDFLQEASQLARLGSGSASRSVYGGYVVWGALPGYAAYSDLYAVPLQVEPGPHFSRMQDAILIVNAGTKKIGSSAGHALMRDHPYSGARVRQALQHMDELHRVLPNGDITRFIDIVENEALSLHALMMSSHPGYFLFEHNTIQIINEIRSFRKSTAIPVCFTLDAGPNVHMLYPADDRQQVLDWIRNSMVNYCHSGQWIDDGIGEGPVQLTP